MKRTRLLIALLSTAAFTAVFAAGPSRGEDCAPSGGSKGRGGCATLPDGADLYNKYCQSCHGADRLGGMGPALLPESLVRLKMPAAIKAIANGLPATQMPGFAEAMNPAEIAALAAWIYTPSTTPPKWDIADIKASQIINKDAQNLPAKPVFKADPTNITLVVEHGDHAITVLDGDVMEPIHRFQTRYALHGGPKFTQDGRFVFWATRDGWITKFDLWNLKIVAEIRAGLNTRNLAVSSDGKQVLVANYLPHNLVRLNTDDLSPQQVIPVVGHNGKTSRVSSVYDARPRQSFVAALKDIPEVWEIPYAGPNAFQPRKVVLKDYLDDFYFDQSYRYLLGASRASPKGQVIDLDSGAKTAELDLPGMPHVGSGITFDYQGRRVMASPNLKDGIVTVIGLDDFKTIKHIKTLGPGFFLRSHETSPYAWADVFSGPEKDAMHVIDKRSLEIVATLRPVPGKTSTHVEFDRYGKFALVSIWEHDGALIVYDAKTLKEIKRLPMKRPVGKYNVWNKTRLSEGTSH